MSGPANRDGSGRFKPGVSGNPTGRPKSQREFEELARSKAPSAIDRLMDLARGGRGLAAVRACEIILDRAYGKAPQALSVTATSLPPVAAMDALAGGAVALLERAVADAEREGAQAVETTPSGQQPEVVGAEARGIAQVGEALDATQPDARPLSTRGTT